MKGNMMRISSLFAALLIGFTGLFSPALAAGEDAFLTSILSPGDEGSQVTLLQTWLSKDATLYPEQVVDGVYGPATEQAVQRFQQEAKIISANSSGGSTYGTVGPATRAGLNARFSSMKGGIASVEGSYDSMLSYEDGAFVPLVENIYELSTPTFATLNVWFNPMKPVVRETPILVKAGDYGVGVAPGGRLYVTTARAEAITQTAPVCSGEWQHISVAFTKNDAVFIYNNEVLEIVSFTPREQPSFFSTLFKRLAQAVTSIFPGAQREAAAPVREEAPASGGVFGGVASFFRGLFGVESEPAPAPVAEEAPALEPAPTPMPALVSAPPETPAPKPLVPQLVLPKIPPLVPTTSVATTAPAAATSTTVVGTTIKKLNPWEREILEASGGRSRLPKDSTPVIRLSGSSSVAISPGSVYTDPGATAYDREDGDISSSIVVGGDTIDYSTPGAYRITYDVTDSSGTAAKQKIRTVTIMEAPTLSHDDQEPRYALAPAGQNVSYSVSSPATADPRFISIDISPLHVYVGDTQTFTVKVSSPNGVESVTTSTELDTVTHELTLTKTGTNGNESTFSGSWVVFDTHVREYRTEFTARSGSGSQNSMTMAWSDPCSGVTQGTNSSLSADCTVSSVYGLDGGNVTIPTGRTLTINNGGTWGFNPGTTITVDGAISKGAGGLIRKGYLFYQNCSGCVNTNTMFFFDSTPQTGYTRANAYSQGSYYSQSFYYSESSYCFAGDTPILMYDGTTKPIKDVRIGDLVMGQSENGKRRPNIVMTLFHHDYRENRGVLFDMLKINGEIEARPEHPFFTTRGLLNASELVVGDTLIGVDGMVPVASIERGPDLFKVYNLEVFPDHTYFAHGILVHNKFGHHDFSLPP